MKKSSDRAAKVAKAGKRSGSYTPTTPNPDNAAAREMGEQQFQATTSPRTASCVCCQTFDGKRLFKTCRFDSGLRFDASRGRVIVPPRKAAAK